MLAAKAPHPNCAYLWMQYISTPQVQAKQAVTYGETPDNSRPAPTWTSCRRARARSTMPTPRPAT